MFVYWFMFLIPFCGVVLARQTRYRVDPGLWNLTMVVFVLIVGFRYEVGGDWFNYLRQMDLSLSVDVFDALEVGDPGFFLLNESVKYLGGTIVWVNLVCAVILIAGLSRLCRAQPLPWLGLLVAVPYLLIVLGMGYTRQATALGFIMVGLVSLGRQQIKTFAFFVLMGALIHKTALLLLPFSVLASAQGRIKVTLWAGACGVMMFYVLLAKYTDDLWYQYVERGYESQGAFVRVAMNALPSTLALVFLKRLFPDKGERRVWFWMAIISLSTIPLVMVASTATDRVALYFLPIQIVVFSRLPLLFAQYSVRKFTTASIAIGYACVQFVWLNFAFNAYAWLPYYNYIFI